jgi:hypothetical protein
MDVTCGSLLTGISVAGSDLPATHEIELLPAEKLTPAGFP